MKKMKEKLSKIRDTDKNKKKEREYSGTTFILTL